VNSEIELFKKSIEGDSSDGIPGIPGVGEATIKKAFSEITYTDRQSFLESCKSHTNPRIKKIGEGNAVIERNTKIISLLYMTGFVRYLPSDVKSDISSRFFSSNPTLDYNKLMRLSHEDEFTSVYSNIKSFFWWAELLTF
jgi:5'-3' exonuclease